MTNKLFSFISFFCLIFIFNACQKEFSFEEGDTGGINTGTAVFTLDGAPGNCASPVFNGTFQAGTLLDTSNRVTVRVNVTTIGTYTITGSPVNGITFSTTGTFTLTGLQNIIFNATGTPAVSGPFNFTLGNGGCSFTITCSGSATNNNDCKDCIYFPVCAISYYEYSDTIINPLTEDTTVSVRHSDYLSSVDTTIDGRLYKKLEISDGTNSLFSYSNCLNGETSNISYNVQSSTSGNIILAIKSIELKANAAEGTNWKDTSVYASGNTLYRKHTIVQKGISRNVSGVNYNDVIKVSVDQSIFYVDPPYGLMPAGVTEYYMAKGIGLIEIITYYENPLTLETYMAYHSVLKTYLIP